MTKSLDLCKQSIQIFQMIQNFGNCKKNLNHQQNLNCICFLLYLKLPSELFLDRSSINHVSDVISGSAVQYGAELVSHSFLSSCCNTEGLGMSCCHWAKFWARPHSHTHMLRTHWSQQRKQNEARRSVLTAVGVSDCRSLLQTLQSDLYASVHNDTKGRLECVRVRRLQNSPALSLLFTCKYNVTATQEQLNSTNNKKHKLPHMHTHTGHGKVSDQFKRNGVWVVQPIVNTSQQSH